MGLMKTAAVKGFIPAGNKVSELRDNLMRLMTTTAKLMEEKFGEAGLEAVSEVFKQLGKEDAIALKERLGLGDTLKDALDAWLVIGHVMGSKIETRWVSETRVETDHPYCPQHEAFLKKGKLYCESVCYPYVEAVAAGIGSGVIIEIIRPANNESACTKVLVVSDTTNE
ncbi:MAG: hypothetical protein ACXAEB_01585 [Candidatus Thorarchaeota archaeon]|jgi:hypothetical protein